MIFQALLCEKIRISLTVFSKSAVLLESRIQTKNAFALLNFLASVKKSAFLSALKCFSALSAAAENFQQWLCKNSTNELNLFFKTSGFIIFISAGERKDCKCEFVF